MALMCINGSAQCTGCMMCQEEHCANCGKILNDKYMLPGDDQLYCRRCILKMTEV